VPAHKKHAVGAFGNNPPKSTICLFSLSLPACHLALALAQSKAK
jgi:hypothetical protein